MLLINSKEGWIIGNDDTKQFAQEVAARIRQLVKESDLENDSQLLKVCNVDPNLLNHMANRGSMPNVQKLFPIAEYFGVSVDYLLGYTTQKDPAYSEVLAEVERVFNKLGISDVTIDEKDRGTFVKYLESLIATYQQIKDDKR
jgi:transcriptional regulator with XRE-family HTH domain